MKFCIHLCIPWVQVRAGHGSGLSTVCGIESGWNAQQWSNRTFTYFAKLFILNLVKYKIAPETRPWESHEQGQANSNKIAATQNKQRTTAITKNDSAGWKVYATKLLFCQWTNKCYSRNKEPFIRKRIKVQINSTLEISVRRLSGLLTYASPVSLRWCRQVRKDSPVLLYWLMPCQPNIYIQKKKNPTFQKNFTN